ncbi:MAG: LytR/AlgR family response regulator transcription factor [Cyclobacteriaceae bacterium]
MKVLIVEDEPIASEMLARQIRNCQQEAEIEHIFDSVEDTVAYFKEGGKVDLAFFDIQLSDGNSFEVFRQVDISNPIIFTTAYDQYTLQAFKVNSIDYLLKPIDTAELARAFRQYEKFYQSRNVHVQTMDKFLRLLSPEYKQRFLLRIGDQYISKPSDEIAFFYAEGKITFACLKNGGKKYILDYPLEKLEAELLDPRKFFRINRKFIVHIDAIAEIRTYVNGRLKVYAQPLCQLDMIVSRERVSDFKDWLNQ